MAGDILHAQGQACCISVPTLQQTLKLLVRRLLDVLRFELQFSERHLPETVFVNLPAPPSAVL